MAKGYFLAAALLLLSPLVLASQISIISPVEQMVSSDDQFLDLGVVGPGQTLEIIASRKSGETAIESFTQGEALWDQLFIVRETLPAGWKAEDSKLFEKPFHAFVTISPTASDGVYSFQIKVLKHALH